MSGGMGGSSVRPRLYRRDTRIEQWISTTQPEHLLGYWPLDDVRGTTARDASPRNHPAVYGAFSNARRVYTGNHIASSFSTAAGSADISGALDGVFDGNEGTLHCRIRVASSAVWTDATARTAVHLQYDADNKILVEKRTDNELRVEYRGAGVWIDGYLVKGVYPTSDVNVTLTWSQDDLAVIAYVDGIMTWLQEPLGVFAGGGAVAAASTRIGARSTTLQPWSGQIAHVAVWDTVLTPYEVARLHARGTTLLTVGDSRTAGQDGKLPYPYQMKDRLPSYTIASYGIPGDSLAQMAARVPGYASIARGAVSVVWGGTNDTTDGLTTASEFYDRLVTLCDLLRDAGARVIVCTEISNTNAAHAAISWDSTVMPALNTLIRDNYATFADGLCDLGAIPELGAANAADNTTWFSADKVHPTTAGYGLVADAVADAVTALG